MEVKLLSAVYITVSKVSATQLITVCSRDKHPASSTGRVVLAHFQHFPSESATPPRCPLPLRPPAHEVSEQKPMRKDLLQLSTLVDREA
jgi:hypothetical protein